MALVAPILIVLALGGGTSLAAERAVPGDTLYPVKIEVNERVRGALTFSAEGEARLATRLTERRLAEAEQLIAEDRFDAEKQAELEARISARLIQAESAAERMAERGDGAQAAEIRARLSGSLDAHTAILGAVSADRSEGGGAEFVANLRARTEAARPALEAMTIEFEYDTENTRAAILRAEALVENTRSMLRRASGNIGAELSARIETRIEVAETSVANAKVAFAAEAYARAHESVREAVRITNEVQVVIRRAASASGSDETRDLIIYPMPIVPARPADTPTSSDGTSGNIRIDDGGIDLNVSLPVRPPIGGGSYPIAQPGWSDVDVNRFVISLPQGWRYNPRQGFDSFTGEFISSSAGVALMFDYGMYGGDPSRNPNPTYNLTTEEVNGHRAYIMTPKVSGQGEIGIFFTNIGEGGQSSLKISGYNVPSRMEGEVMQIVRSVRLK